MNFARAMSLAGTIVLCWATMSAKAATPVARILQVEGRVQIVAPERDNRPARTYGALSPREQLQLPKDSSIQIAFRGSGRRATVTAKGKAGEWLVTSDGLTPEEGVTFSSPPKELARTVLASIGDLPDIAPGGVSILRGPVPEKSTPRLRPINKSSVLSTKPKFEWPAVAGAGRYELTVFDQYNKRLWTTVVEKELTATPPDKLLAIGRKYNWEVTAKTDAGDSVAHSASFDVIDSKDAADVMALADTDDAGLLALAACGFEQQGLLEDSIRTFEALQKLQPTDPVFPAALSDLYERAGEPKIASLTREKAVELGFEFESRK